MNKKDQWLLIKHDDAFATDLDYDAEDFNEEAFSSGPGENSKKLDLKSLIKPAMEFLSMKNFNLFIRSLKKLSIPQS